MSKTVYDLIVVGGGPVGLATAYEAAKDNMSVIVLEQNNFFNQAGSSGDLARMYRTMYTEPFMAKLAKQSLDIWNELESDAGVSLRSMTGLLNFGDAKMGEKTPEGTLLGPIDNLRDLDMQYQELNAYEIEAKWPFKNLPKDKETGYKGLFAPDNGVINVQLLLRTLHRLAKDYGAHTRQQVEVTKLTPTEDGELWTVEGIQSNDNKIEFTGRKIAITGGAYVNKLLQESFDLILDLDIWEMTACYWNVNSGPKGTIFPSMWFLFAPDKVGEDGKTTRSQLMYGFPALEWGPPNVARISVDAATNRIRDPKERRSNVINADDIKDVQDWIKEYVRGVDPTVPASSLTCLQTNVYDNMFVLDFIPKEYLKGGREKSVMIFTAGWAMKFVPLLGRALMQMARDEKSEYALSQFDITREDKKEKKSVILKFWTQEEQNIRSFTMDGQARGSSIQCRHGETPLETYY